MKDQELCEMIIKKVCQIRDVPYETLKLRIRKRKYTQARQIIFSEIRRTLPWITLESIGVYFDSMHHTTIIHGISKVDDLEVTDWKFRSELKQIRQEVDEILSRHKRYILTQKKMKIEEEHLIDIAC